MITVSIVELKAKASELVHRAENGERIVITRNGNNVAELSCTQEEVLDVASRRSEILDLLSTDRTSQRRITAEEIKEWITEGRA